MGLRQTITDKPIVGVCIAIVAFIAVALLLRAQSSNPASAGQRFYYDVTSGELVGFKADQPLPPVTLPSGNQGVLAHVFACGDCSSEQFIGYLEQYTDAYKQAVTVDVTNMDGPALAPMSGHMVAADPNGGQPQWIESTSMQGSQVMRAASIRCDAQGTDRAMECVPQ